MSEIPEFNDIPTKKLVELLYLRLDDNLFGGGERYDPFLELVGKGEKLNLWQGCRLMWEEYKDFYSE